MSNVSLLLFFVPALPLRQLTELNDDQVLDRVDSLHLLLISRLFPSILLNPSQAQNLSLPAKSVRSVSSERMLRRVTTTMRSRQKLLSNKMVGSAREFLLLRNLSSKSS